VELADFGFYVNEDIPPADAIGADGYFEVRYLLGRERVDTDELESASELLAQIPRSHVYGPNAQRCVEIIQRERALAGHDVTRSGVR
jgi:hypothetical protein